MRQKAAVTLTDESRDKALSSLKRYVDENFDQQIGDLKAGLLLDYVLAELGPAIYNQAIADAQQFFEERTSDLAALCHHTEFPFWQPAAKKPR